MIRKGKTEDAGIIAKIKIDNWRKTYKDIFPDDFLQNLEAKDEEEKYLKNLKEKDVIIYEKDEPIAYCYYGKRKNSEYPDYEGEVFALYVKNDCQNHGIGTNLLQEAIRDLSKECTKVLLWCAKENKSAISFYRKNGLEIIGEEAECIGEKEVEKVALGIDVRNMVMDTKKMYTKNGDGLEEKPKIFLNYRLKKSANYIENEKNIAIYTNPDLIFLKDEPREWFKQIINNENTENIPQKFIDYLVKKDVIETL